MSSKRRTFHVDWDSPSHATGTVKRRPASLSAPLSISNNCFENVEYYELKDCIGGYGLRLLESFDGGFERYQCVVPEFLESGRRSNGMEGGAIKDNGNSFEHPRTRAIPRKEEDRSTNGDSEKFNALSCDASSVEKRSSKSELRDKSNPECHCCELEDRACGEEARGIIESLENNGDCGKERKGRVEEKCIDQVDATSVINVTDLQVTDLKVITRKDFGLKLLREPFEWKAKRSKVTKISGSAQKLEVVKGQSFIPKPKAKKYRQNGRGLVNSSSESSGIGSPLSPLSPQRDASVNVRDVSGTTIKTSGSKSSGLGSPDSPLSPESQKYAAFYLIEEQLQKLRNCPCEKRQAQVNLHVLFLRFYTCNNILEISVARKLFFNNLTAK